MRPTVLRHPLGRWVDPEAAFVALFGEETDVVWLDSGVHAAEGRSYLARAVRSVTSHELDGSIFDFLRGELSNPVEAGDGFQLGWVGWLGYELRFETLGQARTRESRHPDAAFLYFDRAIEFDHDTSMVTLIALGVDWFGELARWRVEAERALLAAVQPLPPSSPPPVTATWAYPDDEYLAMIRECKAAITEGEAYQLCLTTEATSLYSPSPVDTYLRLRRASPSHHGALLRIGGVALLSSSPEQFLSVSPDGYVESKPIKGTRRRGATHEEDSALRTELESSDKERAENLMIVDLMRNDIGRVSETGSVEVTALLEVESYAQVHQLVSTVRGRLAASVHPVDAVASCFPAGSMTGAPKHRATMILDALERRPRGIYSGAFGYFGLDGRIDLAMVIRSIVIDEHGSTIGAGGGITALSVPAEELEEVRIKAASLLAAIGATIVPAGG
jgi:anthranilate synthase component 1